LPEFKFEALWSIANVASGTSDQTQSIINKGGIQKLIALIDYPIQEIQEQAIWATGNIAGDSVKVRDRVISLGGLEKIIKYLSTAERESLIKHCVWAISNFCRSKPPPEYDALKPCIDFVIGGFYKVDDNEYVIDACWILSYLSEAYKKSLKKILDTQCLPKLFSYLEYLYPLIFSRQILFIQLPILRIVGNLVAGNAQQTQKAIDAGILPYLLRTMFHEKRAVRKETCWIISNIAAGTQIQIEALIINNFLPVMTSVVKNDDPEVIFFI
jgi:importin subunit alpha-1